MRREIAAALVAGAAALALPTSVAAAGRITNGRIAFTSNRSGHFQIYSVCLAGFPLNRLTHDNASDISPHWSPDGRKVAFMSNRSGHFQIYVMYANGSGLRRVTNDDASDNGPVWSPDGRHIAFFSDRTGTSNIYVMKPDGSDQMQLTNSPAPVYDESPAWSPDGTRIAFESTRAGGLNEIFVMPASGGTAMQLTTQPDSGSPAWSPNGRKIAFASNRTDPSSEPAFELYVMNADGSAQRVLTSEHTRYYARNVEDVDGAAWSPDGKWLLYAGIEEAGARYVTMIRGDGGGVPRNVAESIGENGGPSWGTNTSGCKH